MRRPRLADSAVVRAIRKYREEVARDELATLRRLARLWVPSYRELRKQVDALTSLIQQKRDKGEPVEVEYLYSLDRYQTMMDQAEQMIRKYNKAAAGQIHGTEVEMAEMGAQNGKQLISIAEPDNPMWTRVNKRETRIAAGMTANGSPLDNLLAKSFDAMKEGLEQALITGISTGQGSSWIAQRMMEAAEIPEQRALLIARTEVNRAYRQANWEQMQSSGAVRGYRRMCYPPTACFACLMLDGEFYPVDSEPCDHPNGKCSFVPVTKHFDPADDPSWQRGRDWFMEQDEATQRKLMGPGRFDLWKQQGLDPRDMVYIKPNATWGGSPAVVSLKNLLGYRGGIPKELRISARTHMVRDIILEDRDAVSEERLIEIFGERTEISESDALSFTNPKYSDKNEKHYRYHDNCQRCIGAYELRRRGFDVEALPAEYRNDNLQRNWHAMFTKARDYELSLQGDAKKAVIAKMKLWGNGSRAMIGVDWKNGGGHMFIAENRNGKIIFLDPQRNLENVGYYFSNAKKGCSDIIRIDNSDFSDWIFRSAVRRDK